MPLARDHVAANIAAVKQAEESNKMGAAESSESGTTTQAFTGEQSREDEENVYVSLTHDALDASKQMARVKSAKAGAVVLFAGEWLSPLPRDIETPTQHLSRTVDSDIMPQ